MARQSWSWRWKAWFETSWVRAVRIRAESLTRSCGPRLGAGSPSASGAPPSVRNGASLTGVQPRQRILARLAYRSAARLEPALEDRLGLRRADPGHASRHRLPVSFLGPREPVAAVELGLELGQHDVAADRRESRVARALLGLPALLEFGVR